MTTLLKGKYDNGVIVGRFQVPELTEAHKNLINLVRESHKQVIVVIGVSPLLGSKQNPLGFTARMQMIQSAFPDVLVTYIKDKSSDKEWSQDLDYLIRVFCPLGSVCLYGGRNSFIPRYHGIYPTFEAAELTKDQGTEIREDVGKQVIDSPDFRKGIIYSCQNQYPKVFQTVDIAVTRKLGKWHEVLLGRRKEHDLLQFFGGFVDPADKSLEDAAKRELREEVDVESEDEFHYVGSSLIDDWRYNNTSERIMTALFQTDYVFGSGKPDEGEAEFHSTNWIKLSKENLEEVKPNHRILFEKLIQFMIVRREDE